MARVNVYLPDDLADAARKAGLNVSGLAQHAIRDELHRRDTDEWLARVAKLRATPVTHDQVIDALDAARDELGTRG